VTTPTGKPVAMVHCNTCTSELNAWVKLFSEVAALMGGESDAGKLFPALFRCAMEGEADGGGLMAFNYFAGEPVTGLEDGRPLVVRRADAPMSLANFMRTQIYSAVATLQIGMDLLFEREQVELDQLTGHGGLFKTPVVGQKLLAGALNTPVTVMETASEGGAWGMAVLAAYRVDREEGETLEQYLERKVFANVRSSTLVPDSADVEGFRRFIQRYRAALAVERAAVESL